MQGGRDMHEEGSPRTSGRTVPTTPLFWCWSLALLVLCMAAMHGSGVHGTSDGGGGGGGGGGVVGGPTRLIQARCSACRAVANELRLATLSKRPRNSTLLSKEEDPALKALQASSSLLDFKMTELQAMTILEEVCNNVSQWYTVGTFKIGDRGQITDVWYKWGGNSPDVPFPDPRIKTPSRFPDQAERMMSARLAVFCRGVLDDHEVAIEEAMSKGETPLWKDAGEIIPWLCGDPDDDGGDGGDGRRGGLIGACPDDIPPVKWIDEEPPVPPPEPPPVPPPEAPPVPPPEAPPVPPRVLPRILPLGEEGVVKEREGNQVGEEHEEL